jgi:hypothetical protein
MAYMNQEMKAKIAANLKPVLKKYGIKGSLRTTSRSITLTVKSGNVDFGGVPGREINPYWYHEHFNGTAKQFLDEAFAALKSADWVDNSDVMTDYIDVRYYFHITLGKWDKPYQLVA